MKLVNLLLILPFLASCATPDPVIKYETVEVKIPIPVECKTPVPPKPDYNFDKLRIEDTIYDKTKALLADRLLRDAYEKELKAALESCK